MPDASLNDLLSALKNGVQALNDLTRQMRTSFPAITSVSTSSIPSSTSPVAYGSVSTSSGGSYLVLLYSS